MNKARRNLQFVNNLFKIVHFYLENFIVVWYSNKQVHVA